MIETVATLSRPVLNLPLIRRIRRNHGFEHATIHMLSRQIKGLQMAGRADASGFLLYGEAETEAIEKAAREALDKMRAGQHKLAIHPNCGTNLVTTSLMTSLAALMGITGARTEDPKDLMNRLPLVILLSIIALIASQPVGLSVQEHITTLGDPGDLEIVEVVRHNVKMPLFGGSNLTVHRVRTRYG